ncbi:Uncharacterised protein [Enterobacter asburiae]|nr:Uncharacterised protein [Enterobacter asburiae]CZW46090.1 Uncharacterised protein [Enterobacter cloacae]SAE90714.1 Uncharacterised protein [Enterobacter asburiae]SAF53568.1 Uncharacterised protein [Enterobacter asburiae]SAG94961.1 Uncharacterised protein [Enterobacter asburiae]
MTNCPSTPKPFRADGGDISTGRLKEIAAIHTVTKRNAGWLSVCWRHLKWSLWRGLMGMNCVM